MATSLPIALKIAGPSPTSYATGSVPFEQGRLSLSGLVRVVASMPPVSHALDGCGLSPLIPLLSVTADLFTGMGDFCAAITEGRPASGRPSIPELRHPTILLDLKEFPRKLQSMSSSDSLRRLRASVGHLRLPRLQLELATRSIPRKELGPEDPLHAVVSAGVGISVPRIGILSLYQNFTVFGSDTLVKGANTFVCLDRTNPEDSFADSEGLYRLTLRPSQDPGKPHPVTVDCENGIELDAVGSSSAGINFLSSVLESQTVDGVADRSAKFIAGLLRYYFGRVMDFLGREQNEGGATIDLKRLEPYSRPSGSI